MHSRRQNHPAKASPVASDMASMTSELNLIGSNWLLPLAATEGCLELETRAEQLKSVPCRSC